MTMRKQDLKRYRERLLALEERLRDGIESLDASISEEGNTVGSLSHDSEHPADHDSEGLGAELAMEHSEKELLRLVEDALGRIEKGGYGICEDCGSPIGPARLDAVPYAAVCIACEREREREAAGP